MTMASVVAQSNGDGYSPNMVLPRPQIGIERLQARRASNEPKEAMNCKSCRKRKVRMLFGNRTLVDTADSECKIKCNRLKPTCEACQAFNCACIYGGSYIMFHGDCFSRRRLLTGYSRCYTEETRSEDRRIGSTAQAGKWPGETAKRREQARCG